MIDFALISIIFGEGVRLFVSLFKESALPSDLRIRHYYKPEIKHGPPKIGMLVCKDLHWWVVWMIPFLKLPINHTFNFLYEM